MPHPIYYMNPPPNPFWDFVADLEGHPFFRGAPRPSANQHGVPTETTPANPAQSTSQAAAEQSTPEPELSEKVQGKQPTVEDPAEVDPSTIKPNAQAEDNSNNFRCRGRGRFSHAFNNDEDSTHRGRGGHCRGRGRGQRDFRGPPPFMGGHPFWAHPGWAPPDHRGPPPPPPGFPHHHHGPHDPDHRGPPGPPHGHPHRHGPRPGFDLSAFLNRLGDKLGIDLSGAAEGLGLTADRFTAGKTSTETDFEPRTDIFENPSLYTIHLSLPGAKKSDIGVDYDGEHSLLRITGVVHRPDVDEQMLSELQVDGRKRETGVFEKSIRLGTKRDPANIDVAAISAKMTDGVLVVKVPKVEPVHHRREIPIAADANEADYEDEYSEKPVLFDADQASETTEIYKGSKEAIDLIDMKDSEKTAEVEKDEAQAEKSEPLPVYKADAEHEEEDWEKFSDTSGEAGYIKINVD